MVAHNQGYVPGETWKKKHAVPVKFHLSGPPRDIVGLRDMRHIDNRYQRQHILELRERDNFKFLGTKDEEPQPEQFPEKPDKPIPTNQKMVWYEMKAVDHVQARMPGIAYWYLQEGIKKARTVRDRRRLEQWAQSVLQTWRKKVGLA